MGIYVVAATHEQFRLWCYQHGASPIVARWVGNPLQTRGLMVRPDDLIAFCDPPPPLVEEIIRNLRLCGADLDTAQILASFGDGPTVEQLEAAKADLVALRRELSHGQKGSDPDEGAPRRR